MSFKAIDKMTPEEFDFFCTIAINTLSENKEQIIDALIYTKKDEEFNG